MNIEIIPFLVTFLDRKGLPIFTFITFGIQLFYDRLY